MDGIMQETILNWELNGKTQSSLLCSPGDERALLTGHLLTGMTAPSPAAIREIRLEENRWKVLADPVLSVPIALDERLSRLPVRPVCCPLALTEILDLSETLTAVDNSAGQHAALLRTEQETILCQDIGRHNALDKAVGKAVLAGRDLQRAVYCTSGRVSAEILCKAAAAGIPVVCTRKQVGDLAVQAARRLGVTIVQARKPLHIYGNSKLEKEVPAGYVF